MYTICASKGDYFFKIFFWLPKFGDSVYKIYICIIMAKDTASFKIRKELREALQKKALKQDRTLSWLLADIVEDYAKRNKIAQRN